jgi:hypothetical protein
MVALGVGADYYERGTRVELRIEGPGLRALANDLENTPPSLLNVSGRANNPGSGANQSIGAFRRRVGNTVGTTTTSSVHYPINTLDYVPFIKSQLTRTQLPSRPCVVQMWYRNSAECGVHERLVVQHLVKQAGRRRTEGPWRPIGGERRRKIWHT